MKKTISLAVAIMLIVCCFAACGNSKKIDGAELYTDMGNEEYQVVTDKDGDIERDSDGRLIVAVTDEDGKQVTNNNGDKVTSAQEFDHALVIGNTIDLQKFYLTIPDGWSNNSSYTGIEIKKDNSEDTISVVLMEDVSIVDAQKNCKEIIDVGKTNYDDAEIINKTVRIAGKDCFYYGFYIPGATDRDPLYLAFALYESDDGIYKVMITSQSNLEEDNSEITSILSSIQFR